MKGSKVVIASIVAPLRRVSLTAPLRRASVIGLGLIGGSAALALGARGWDRDADVRARARRLGIDAADSLEAALDGAELVVVAVPTAETADALREAAGAAPGALLTDVASLKSPLAAAAGSLPQAVRYVGGHPMAGGSAAGVEGAAAGLFSGRTWFLVETSRSDAASIELLAARLREIGAVPRIVDAERHDAAMTWASHLPLAAAAALARAAAGGIGNDAGGFAGPGLLDSTRLAETPLPLALELWLSDPPALADAAEALARELSGVATLLRREDRAALESFLDEAAEARKRFLAGS